MLKTLFLRTVGATRVRASVLAVSLFGALYFVGDFPGRQSLVLAGVGVVVFWIVWWLQKVPFVPYRVYVAPDMRSILTDFQLVENTEEAWAYVQEVIEKLPHRPGNVWEYGFSVFFLTPELIYDNQWKEFRTRMKMSTQVDPAGWWEDEIIPRLLPEPISLYIERDYRGYSLGAVLRGEYWEKVRHNEALKGIRKDDVSLGDPQCAGIVMFADKESPCIGDQKRKCHVHFQPRWDSRSCRMRIQSGSRTSLVHEGCCHYHVNRAAFHSALTTRTRVSL